MLAFILVFLSMASVAVMVFTCLKAVGMFPTRHINYNEMEKVINQLESNIKNNPKMLKIEA